LRRRIEACALVEVVELGATITKSFTFVEVLPIVMSSPAAEGTAAVYALASVPSDRTAPDREV